MISVIITTHAALDKYLLRCLQSVCWQLEKGDEVIVVSDGGTLLKSDIQNLLVRFGESLFFEFTEKVSGVSITRNLGLKTADNPWVKFLDVDDLLAPFALNAFRKVAAKIPETVAVVSGQQVKVVNGVPLSGVLGPIEMERIIERQNPMLVSMAFVRRAHAQAVGGFDPNLPFEEDWDFWLKLYRANHDFATIAVPVCYYWIHEAERAEKEKTRVRSVNGMDVADIIKKRYSLP